jgi:tetratricopeptide (TPR) repeat protein
MNNPKKLISIILIFAGLGLTVCRSPGDKLPDDPEAILKRPAFASITDSLNKFPENAELYFRRAELLSKNNLHEIALDDYKKSWGLNPIEATGLRYASELSISGRPIDVILLTQHAMILFPSNREFKRLLGDALVQSGRIKEALDLYQILIDRDSADFEAWYEMGLLYEQARDTTLAIKALRKSYAIQPVDTYALELAHIYAETKNPEALTICDQIISNDSTKEWVDPFFIKGIYYSNKQQYTFALVQFDSCIRRDWKFTDAYIEKGIAYFKLKNYQQALNTFLMAATVTNTSADAYYWTGRCYEATFKKEDAILNYERAIALDRNFTEAIAALKRIKS